MPDQRLASCRFLAFFGGFCIALTTGCSNSSDDCSYTATCASTTADGGPDGSGGGSDGGSGGGGSGGDGSTSGTGGMTGNGGTGGDGGACDPTMPPSVAPCRVADSDAVFVAPTGSNDNIGTMAAPVKTIAKGIELATTNNKIVIVCAASYTETVSIGAGVEIYGGFACPGTATPWAYQTSTVTSVSPVGSGYALDIHNVSSDVIIEDMAFTAHDAAMPGQSSVAAFVVNSPKVTLRRVTLTAGAGANGVDGVNAGFMFPTADALVGNDGTDVSGGQGNPCTCSDGSTTQRGSGGDPPAQGGGLGSPDYQGPGGEGGDATAACTGGGTTSGSGSPGAAGPNGTDSAGANVLGSLTTSGWASAAGVDGPNGSNGQGGGGGAGKSEGGGGSGGCGGCGGKGGSGGGGGGASVGLLALDAPVTLEGCDIVTANAGNGGTGAAGQDGQQSGGGGGNGFGMTADKGCAGGAGGPGGNGGAGGGGAGGISVGIAYKGAVAPMTTMTTITTGTAGMAGIGGVANVNDGIAGVKQDIWQAP